jgi:hypothetical protein
MRCQLRLNGLNSTKLPGGTTTLQLPRPNGHRRGDRPGEHGNGIGNGDEPWCLGIECAADCDQLAGSVTDSKGGVAAVPVIESVSRKRTIGSNLQDGDVCFTAKDIAWHFSMQRWEQPAILLTQAFPE